MFDWLIVGAGFAGSVLAERLASQRNERVMIIDRRPHIGGNAYDHLDAAGLLIHRYGPHIFHTNAQQVADYLSRFTSWRPYEHRVLAEVKRPGSGETLRVPIPINLDTINRLYGLSLTEAEVEAWMAARAEPVAEIGPARMSSSARSAASSTSCSSAATPASNGRWTRASWTGA
ncbi:NAD(P)-binding protein [Siccirubricoccus deserti]